MSDPKRMREFQMLWHRYGGQGANRDDRLLWLTRLLGKPVDSANELSAEELELACRELRKESGQGSRVVSMRGGPVRTASREQLWKIRQLECWLGWRESPERLAGLLRAKFRGVERAADLGGREAWRVIEMLFGVAAAGRRGKEKAAEVRRLKELLKTWRPEKSDVA